MNNNQNIENLLALRHSTEHVLHQAVKELYPSIQLAMGPATEEGYYFDFDGHVEGQKEVNITDSDFPKIEKRMAEIIKLDLPLTRHELSEDEARKLFAGNPYKLDWINGIVKNKDIITVYWTGKPGEKDSMVDLCKGPHLKSTGEIKAFKLLSVAGAYWHGDEKNKMLTRIYGTAFSSQEDLDKYLWQVEEAKKRDHRKLGKELDLFVIHEDIGKGLPLLTPKGTVIRNQIIAYERELEIAANFQEVWTPHIAKNDLYKRTGHWDHYQEVMYAPFGIDDETYVLKPMNCPHHYMIYSSQKRSYRELPFRLCEVGTCYRYEKTGELGGLTRVRALSIDDSHILMSEDQIEQEFATCIGMVKSMYKAFGLTDYRVRLSLNDPSNNLKYIDDSGTWSRAGNKLEKILKNSGLEYEVGSGEASFYGPKIDFMVKDSLGRDWQMSTLQLDLFMAKRLELTYTDAKGQEQYPVILHRGLTGSLERTIGLLIEHYAGAFPLWLAPVQVTMLPISENELSYTKELSAALAEAGLRVEIDESASTLGKKMIHARNNKVPYLVIIGKKEVEDKTLTLKDRAGEQTTLSLDKTIDKLTKEAKSKL